MSIWRRTYYRVLTKLRVEAGGRLPEARSERAQRTLRVLARRNLSWLAAASGTDKRAHAHNYVPLYETHLGHLRDQPITLLEIGILDGASLRMWRDYFHRGAIVGLDIEEKSSDDPRTTIFRGDQSAPDVLETLRARGPFDVIIDDGSHVGEHIWASFEGLFAALKSGGFYVIEDMQTAYRPDYGGGPPGTPRTSTALVKDLVDAVNRKWMAETTGDQLPAVRAVHVYEKIAFVEKA
jgi:hypothetical protein